MPERESNFLEHYKVHEKPEASKAAKRKERRTGEKGIAFDRSKRIEAYLERLEEIFAHPDPDKRERRINLYKEKFLYPATIIKEENFPESYFDYQAGEERRRGFGQVAFNSEQKKEEIRKVQEAQKDSLDAWIEYLTGQECEDYSSDVKFFAMQGILKLGDYNPDKHSFSKRQPGTASPFATINHLAVSNVLSALEAKHHNGDLSGKSEVLLSMIDEKHSFGDMYEQALKEIDEATGERNYEITKGKWFRFKKGSDYNEMIKELSGRAKYICIAQSGHAQRYLSAGDIDVYISEDHSGNFKTARIAIASIDGKIYEIRGDYNANEDIDPTISNTDILKEKSRDFSNGDDYLKKDRDMRLLTSIDQKMFRRDKKTGKITEEFDVQLTKEELRFLYEIDDRIDGFGYHKDPRIEELRYNRDKREDIAKALGCDPKEVSLTKEEALRGGIKFHRGDLYLDGLTSAKGLKLPERVDGILFLSRLTSAKGLKLPEQVGGDIYLEGLTSAEKDKLRKKYPHLKDKII